MNRRAALLSAAAAFTVPALAATTMPVSTDNGLRTVIADYMATYEAWLEECTDYETLETRDAQFRKTGRFQIIPKFIFVDMSPQDVQRALWRDLQPKGCIAAQSIHNGLNNGVDRKGIVSNHDEQRSKPGLFVTDEAKRQGITPTALLDASQARVLDNLEYCSANFQKRIEAIGFSALEQRISDTLEAQAAAFMALVEYKAITPQEQALKRDAMATAFNEHDVLDMLYDGADIDRLIYALAGVPHNTNPFGT